MVLKCLWLYLIFLLRVCIIWSLSAIFSAAHGSVPSHTIGQAPPLPARPAATAAQVAVAAVATTATAATVAAGARAPRTVPTAKAATTAPDSEIRWRYRGETKQTSQPSRMPQDLCWRKHYITCRCSAAGIRVSEGLSDRTLHTYMLACKNWRKKISDMLKVKWFSYLVFLSCITVQMYIQCKHYYVKKHFLERVKLTKCKMCYEKD